MTCRISRFEDGESLSNYITIFLVEGIWKVHIFRHLFVCFQTIVYTLGEFHKNRNNSTVFEELSVSIVDLMVAIKRHFRPSNPQLTLPTLQIQYWYSLICRSKMFNDKKGRGFTSCLLSLNYLHVLLPILSLFKPQCHWLLLYDLANDNMPYIA